MMRIRAATSLVVLTLFAAACAEPGGVSDDGEAAATETSETASVDTTTASAASSSEADTAQSEGAEEPESSSAGGADTTTSSEAESETSESQQTEETGDTTSTTRPTKEPERVPDDTTPPVTGETPADLLARIIADAADRAGVSDAEVIVIRDEFVIWNDGSLGCAKPGEVYTQAVVDGYWVVLEGAGTEYDYRASTDGYFVLCAGPGLQPRPPSG